MPPAPRRSFALLVAAVIVGLRLSASGQPGSASISGVVVDENGRAVARAAVAVTAPGPGTLIWPESGRKPARQVTADDNGRFTIDGLAAGEVAVVASKAGYVEAQWNPRSTPIVRLKDGASVTLRLRLHTGAVISGRVVDRDGTPAAGIRVRLDSRLNQSGKIVGVPSTRSAETNSRGEYRLYGIPPGSYIVAALSDLSFEGALSTGDRTAVAYVPVYFPNAVIRTAASPVTVMTGEERSGVDFALKAVEVNEVTVTLVAPPGMSIQRGRGDCDAAWTYRHAETQPFADLMVDAGAARLICPSLIAGPHTIEVVATPESRGATGSEPPPLWGSAEVFVSGRPLEISITLQPGEELSGRVTLDRSGAQPPVLSAFWIALAPAGESYKALSELEDLRVSPDRQGAFTFQSVPAGRYLIDGQGPEGWALAAATVAGRDILDLPFDVMAASASAVQLTFSRAQTTISGRVRGADGFFRPDETVIAFPVDERYWLLPSSRRVQMSRTDPTGRYDFHGLLPGPYLIAVDATGVIDDTWDVTALMQLSPSARRIVLGPGQTMELELTRQ